MIGSGGQQNSSLLDDDDVKSQFNKTMDGRFILTDNSVNREESWAKENLRKQAERLRVQTQGNLQIGGTKTAKQAHMFTASTTSQQTHIEIGNLIEKISLLPLDSSSYEDSINYYFQTCSKDSAYYEEVTIVLPSLLAAST